MLEDNLEFRTGGGGWRGLDEGKSGMNYHNDACKQDELLLSTTLMCTAVLLNFEHKKTQNLV